MNDTAPYSIPRQAGRWRAITLAIMVHAALFAFLWIGIRWQSQTPITVEAEVWNLQTKEAAPRALEPPPAPQIKPLPPTPPKPVIKETPVVKPDIALEQEKQRKAKEDKERQAKQEAQKREQAQARLEEEKREKLAADLKKKEEAEKKRKQEEAEAKRLAQVEKMREEDLRRISGMVGAGGAGDAPKSQGLRGDPSYANTIRLKIRSNTIFAVSPDLQGNPAVEYDVRLLPDGTLRGPPRKLKSSGIAAFDEAVRRAIELSQPFPPDKSGTVPSELIVSHQPKEQQ